MPKHFKQVIAIAIISLIIVQQLPAITATLSEDTLTPRGSGSNKNIFLSNPSDTLKAVEIYVTSRKHDVNGNETREEVDDKLFLIYPALVLLDPGQEKISTIRYLGPQELKKEQHYRLVVKEVPKKNSLLQKKPEQVSLQIVLQFIKSLYVKPKSAYPKVQITAAIPSQNNVANTSSTQNTTQQEDQLLVIFENKGSAHLILRNPSIKLKDSTGATTTLTIDNDDFPMRNLLSGDIRHVYIPWPKQLKKEPLEVKIVSLNN